MRNALTILVCLLAVSCERAHPSTETVDAFVMGLKYGDEKALFDAHIDSTHQGEFCRKEFRDLLDKAKTLSKEGCDQVRALTQKPEMPDELQLAAQTGRWVCENPEGSCVDYARTVFDQAVAQSPIIVDGVSSVAVRKLMGDETAAVAYVDITLKSGERAHRALKLKLVGEGWRVAGGFLTP